jgi:hypothetical protein
MRTLWTFGDSFTADIKDLSDNHRQYLNIVKQLEIVSWPNLLAEKLNLNIKNLAIAGSSNYQIFQDFCDVSHLINEKDIVIIGWGLISKFRKVKNNEFQNIYPNLNGVDNEIITDRNQDKWVEEIYSWENLIKTFSKSKYFNVYFWSGEEFRLNHKLNNQTLKQNNCLSMYVETEGKIPDTHLGINGHNKAADVFLNYINNE